MKIFPIKDISKMVYLRNCKFCENDFKTEQRHSKVCEDCKKYNHHNKIVRNLFNGKHKNL